MYTDISDVHGLWAVNEPTCEVSYLHLELASTVIKAGVNCDVEGGRLIVCIFEESC